MPLPPQLWPPFSSRLSDGVFPSFFHFLPPLPHCGLTKIGLPFRPHVLMIDDI